jgi:UDP:flavonoid glycosyltransferase YjiC (YdhE family)
MRLLFVTIPDTGHLLPLIPVASCVAAAGHSVLFASLENARSKVESAGLTFLSLGAFSEEQAEEYAANNRCVQWDVNICLLVHVWGCGL